MRNILLKIEYIGTNYRGWQTQKKNKPKKNSKTELVTIQETIEKILRRILQEDISLICSGRTDAGVHAKEQCVNFKTNSEISLNKLKKALNSLLPNDIIIKSAKRVRANFHARYDAKSKIYRYLILNRGHGSVFMRETALHLYRPLAIEPMRRAAKILKGRHDFKSFQATDKVEKNSIRTIKAISVKKRGNLIMIDIEADGFLWNMVRNIVGTLLEIGRGKIKEASIKKILRAKMRKYAGPTAPARGLCLLRVVY